MLRRFIKIDKLPKIGRRYNYFRKSIENDSLISGTKSADSVELMKINEKLDKLIIALEKIPKDTEKTDDFSEIISIILLPIIMACVIGVWFIIMYLIIRLIEFIISLL